MKLEHSFSTTQPLVIKIGSALLLDEAEQRVNELWLASLLDDVLMLTQGGHQIVLVTSGSIPYGKQIMGVAHEVPLNQKQALAAVGQIQLMHTYQALLAQRGIKAAQILLTAADCEDRRRYLNIRNTFNSLLAMGIIPIVNENDSVATAEMRYGDNDRLSARVAQMVDAGTLILLSDIDGLYTEDPTKSTQATFIPEIEQISPEVLAMAGESASRYGSGGMITKLAAAKIATSAGCKMLITLGKLENPIRQFMETKRGTWFYPSKEIKSARKVWIKENLRPFGQLTIDNGALQALLKGASLLPVGVTEVEGHFQKGAAVQVLTQTGKEVARGLVNYSNHDVQSLMGQPSSEIKTILGYEGCHEVIHRDNLIVMEC